MKVRSTGAERAWVSAAADAKRLLVQPRVELEVARDLIATQRAMRSIRHPLAPPNGRTLLVVLVRDSVFEAKLHLSLAQALRTDGWRVVVLAQSRKHTRAVRVARAMGADDVVYRSDLAERCGSTTARAALATELTASVSSAPELKDIEYEGADLGRHVFASVSRETLDGSPDPTAPAVRPIVERLMMEGLTSIALAGHIADTIDPELVLLEEANYAASGPLVDLMVERGTDVIQAAPMFSDDGIICKRLSSGARRVHPASVSPSAFEAILREPRPADLDTRVDLEMERRYSGHYTLQAHNQPSNTRHSRARLHEMLDLDPARPTAVIFAHVLWDASLFFGTDLYDDYGHWLVETLRGAIANTSANWIVRTHPSNVFRVQHGDVTGDAAEVTLLRAEFPALPDHVRVLLPEADVSTVSLFRSADVGVTVRGTPGLEMAAHGKPVLTAGTGHYIGQGFTIDSSSRAEYQQRLALVHELGPLDADATERARIHVDTVFRRRLWRARTFPLVYDFRPTGFHPLDRNVATTRPITPDELRAGADLRAFADWLASGTPEYLDPPPGRNGSQDLHSRP